MAALQALYEMDVTGHSGLKALERVLASDGLKRADGAMARRLIEAVEANRTRLDARIAELAPSWPPEQMPVVDRNILRIALAEMLLLESATPPRVVVNEAVELAKVFGSEGSRKLINGALRSMLG